MIEYLLLLLAWPFGKLLYKATKDEKEIYSKRVYFPSLIPSLGILAIIFSFVNRAISLTLLFMFILIFSWSKQ